MTVGIDLVRVSRVAESLAQFGERFLRRVFTDGEIAYANAAPALAAERLAARFAAKEAAIKALGLVERGVGWREIEVTRAPSGAAQLSLHGAARDAAAEPAWSSSRSASATKAITPPPWSSPCGTRRPRNMMVEKIRKILADHGRLNKDADTLDEGADLYQAGMTSHASVNVMLALEGEFDVEFPDHMLKRSVFESIAAMRAAIERADRRT